MRKSVFTIFVLLFSFQFIGIDSAFSQFTFSGEYRPRTEYRHGYKMLVKPDQDPAFFISQRARLNFNYDNKKFRVFFSLQDIRTWGSTSQLNISDGFFSVHQAWGEYFFTKHFGLRVGRQELVYDDSRIFGNVGWAQQARSHDLALFRYKKKSFKIHLGLAYNQDKEQLNTNIYTVPKNYKTLQFLWLRKDFDNFGGSLFLMNNGVQYVDTSNGEGSVRYSQTMGTYLNFKLGIFRLNVSGYYQMGKDPANRDLSAGYLMGEVLLPFKSGFTPVLGMEHLSGTDQYVTSPTDSKNNSFTPLYGTNHKFNGFMDYFYVGNHGNSVGLNDIYLVGKYKKKKFSSLLAFHYFASAAKVLDPANTSNTMNNYLGLEMDIVVGWALAKNVSLNAGYSQMFASETMKVLKEGDHNATNNWAWLMLTFKPQFFSNVKDD
jgi:hypothetical protein